MSTPKEPGLPFELAIPKQALLHAIATMGIAQPAQQDACRIFHGRGGLCTGCCEQWTLDFFSPVFVLTS